MESHCNSIVCGMPDRGDTDTKQFSITLPLDAVEMIENGLIPFGLYGKKLATVSAALILDMLKTTAVRTHIREGREKVSRSVAPESGR
jgi:hypothetical protein